MALALSVSACEAIAAIFEARIWVGVIMVVVVLAIVGFTAARLRASPPQRCVPPADHAHEHEKACAARG